MGCCLSLLFLAALLLPVPAGWATPTGTTTLVIRDLSTQGWLVAAEGATGGSVSLVTGPPDAPAGGGSLEFVLSSPAQGNAALYLAPELVGLRLDALTDLHYCTYVTNAPGPQAVALQINADADVTDGNSSWQGRLVFEPYNNGSVVLGAWQCWNAVQGKWWATGAPLNGLAPQSSPKPLSTILATFPNAGFNSSFGGMLLKAGSGWSYFAGNVDAVTIGFGGNTMAFDFEASPPSKDACKKDGWKLYGFPNQGQCIRHVNTGK